ncbi:MAG TPA: hypothetical protein PLO33_09705, partial [Kouleothrix sp.]|nr:hypothetical protein [Kouleothrix sp.]
MTKSRANKPSRPGAQGVKTLLTAASLAATLGGWATLSRGLTQAKPQSAPTDQIARAVATLVPSATPQVPSPTFVPLPTIAPLVRLKAVPNIAAPAL